MRKTAKRIGVCVVIAASAIFFGPGTSGGQASDDALVQGFLNPPDSAKPRVWWHWMNGNISKEGIKADFEWFKRAGIAGFQNFDAGLNTPQVVAQRLIFMTPEWKDAFKYAATLADELGLEMAIAGSPGWSESGGPWVTPAQAMKKYVWSETRVEGGRRFSGVLPKPPSTTGPYQNQGGGRGGFGATAASSAPEFYADAAVVAFRAPSADRTLAELQAKVSSSGGSFSLEALTDGDLAQSALLPAAPVGEKAWIQFEFPGPQAVSGLTFITGTGGGRGFGGRGAGAALPAFEASDDGREFRAVAPLPPGARTISFPAVTAKFFRVSIPTPVAAGRGAGCRAAGRPRSAGGPNRHSDRRILAASLGDRQSLPGEGGVLCGHGDLRHGDASCSARRRRA